MASIAELEAKLTNLEGQLSKASAEIVAEIAALKKQIEDGGATTPGIDASVARLEAMAQALDDLNADVPPEQRAARRAARGG